MDRTQGLVDLAVEHYLGSPDFNGLSFATAARQLGLLPHDLAPLLESAIRGAQVTALFGDLHPNPHIRAFNDEPAERQLERAQRHGMDSSVIYPTAGTLERVVTKSDYSARPYSLRLALGQGQLEYASFDLTILEHYRRDPRFHFWCNDVQGTLSIGNDAYESETHPQKHKVGLQSFGFSYSDDLERAVAVFLTDLAGLTPEHQQLWATHEKEVGTFHLHPDFYRGQILGDWGLKSSLTEAFVEELRIINLMCERIGWKPMFRDAFKERPKEFGFLLRCTRKELNDFTLLLDKMMSDNINMSFFPASVERESRVMRADGSYEIQRKGSIALLEEWLGKTFRSADPKPIEDMFATFRDVRRRRQKPAHAVDDDAYDPSLFREQRDLLLRAYDAVRTMRLVLTNHPAARPVLEDMIPEVRDGEIWSM